VHELIYGQMANGSPMTARPTPLLFRAHEAEQQRLAHEAACRVRAVGAALPPLQEGNES